MKIRRVRLLQTVQSEQWGIQSPPAILPMVFLKKKGGCSNGLNETTPWAPEAPCQGRRNKWTSETLLRVGGTLMRFPERSSNW